MKRSLALNDQDFPPISVVEDGVILALWSKTKLGTYQIAKQLRRPEWQIANRLGQIREVAR